MVEEGTRMPGACVCDICLRLCERAWAANFQKTFLNCGHCGRLHISHEMVAALRAAQCGSGPLAGRLTDLARATQRGAISDLETVHQVLSDLDAFLESEFR